MAQLRKKGCDDQLLFATLLVIVIFIIGYIIFGQYNYPSESTIKMDSFENISTDWTVTYADGSMDVISLPTSNHFVRKGEKVSISKILPDNPEYNCIRIWNYGQDVNFYVDNKLVYRYDNSHIYAIGPDRPYYALYFPLEKEYLGKEATLEYMAPNVSSASKISPIYIGDKAALLFDSAKQSSLEIFIGFFLILVGLTVSIVGMVIRHNLKIKVPLTYLGFGVTLCSLWLICNSTGRQYIMDNVSFTRNCAFLLVGLLPVPFAFFFDELQKKRYHILFHCVEALSIANFIVLFILHITGIKGLSQTFLSSLFIVLCNIIVISYTVLRDFFVLRQKNFYNLTATGIFIFGFFVILQLIAYSVLMTALFNGIFIGIGLLLTTLLASIEAVREFNSLYFKHEKAIHQVATLSREAIETIARTVDAKDPYTHHHSTRVAKYAGMLARKLGWDEREVEELEQAALLHDVGKIGIPDSVLNKPTRLTPEEYDIIKSHTRMGAEIANGFSSLKYGHDVTLYHHERYDGQGYPQRLSGKNIPDCARIVTIADAFDAMNSRRIYRDSLDAETIKSELINNKGKQFDPEYLDVFFTFIDELFA